MVRLIDLGPKEDQRRRKLSKFALCIDDAVIFKDHAPLVKMLRSDYQLTLEDRALLANFIDGRLEPVRRRPKGKPMVRLDWLGLAALDAEILLSEWKKRRGGRRKVKLNGSLVNLRSAVCERMAKKHGHPDDALKLEEYLDRPRNRR